MRYHKGERFGLSEPVQSLIFWQLQNFHRLPQQKQKAWNKLIREIGGKDGTEALREALTTTRSLTSVSLRHYYSEAAIQEMCRRFYIAAAKETEEKDDKRRKAR